MGRSVLVTIKQVYYDGFNHKSHEQQGGSIVRLFIAINFNEVIKDHLTDAVAWLKSNSTSGKFTRRENLHITLVFLGEVDEHRLPLIHEAMNGICCRPFQLAFDGGGSFKRRGGDIYWIGIEDQGYLHQIYQQLGEKLARSGFDQEKRPFKPHLTIGRQVIVPAEFDQNKFSQIIPPVKTDVNRISLMKSERIQGQLVYTEIYAADL